MNTTVCHKRDRYYCRLKTTILCIAVNDSIVCRGVYKLFFINTIRVIRMTEI